MDHLDFDRPRKTPRGAGELIVYLDFDGVLHHENVLWHPKRGAYLCAPSKYTLFQHADLLVELLDPYPEVKIVLSTSWSRVYGCDKAAKRLPDSLRKRVVGATFHSRMYEAGFVDSPRGMQVWGDVIRRNPKDWLALDDDYLHWPKWCLDKFIRTHEHEGISDPRVHAEIVEKLAKLCMSNHANTDENGVLAMPTSHSLGPLLSAYDPSTARSGDEEAWDNIVPLGCERRTPDFEMSMEQNQVQLQSALANLIKVCGESSQYKQIVLTAEELDATDNVQEALHEFGHDVSYRLAAAVWKHYSGTYAASWMAGAETVASAKEQLYYYCVRTLHGILSRGACE
jgi:hypothetical protein